MNTESDKHAACQRCGNCCQVDVSAYVCPEDIKRWEREKRDDILAHVSANSVSWSEDGFLNKFGSSINTCRMSCAYLEWHGSLATCAIYETRTNICRNYVPASSDLCPQFDYKNRGNA